MDNSFDHHVHIGQWNDKYFSAEYVFSELKLQGKCGCNFMSTTSCGPLHCDNEAEIRLLYKRVREEINEACITAEKLHFDVKPYYWVVPLFHFIGISFNQVFKELPEYRGLKIHPRAHNWNPNIKERAELLTETFEFARKKNLKIILHTGVSEDDSPCLYEYWYKNFPTVNVILAHCKNLSEIVYLFERYPQVKGDTAMIPNKNLDYLLSNGFENRLLYGSDFPINIIFDYGKEK